MQSKIDDLIKGTADFSITAVEYISTGIFSIFTGGVLKTALRFRERSVSDEDTAIGSKTFLFVASIIFSVGLLEYDIARSFQKLDSGFLERILFCSVISYWLSEWFIRAGVSEAPSKTMRAAGFSHRIGKFMADLFRYYVAIFYSAVGLILVLAPPLPRIVINYVTGFPRVLTLWRSIHEGYPGASTFLEGCLVALVAGIFFVNAAAILPRLTQARRLTPSHGAEIRFQSTVLRVFLPFAFILAASVASFGTSVAYALSGQPQRVDELETWCGFDQSKSFVVTETSYNSSDRPMYFDRAKTKLSLRYSSGLDRLDDVPVNQYTEFVSQPRFVELAPTKATTVTLLEIPSNLALARNLALSGASCDVEPEILDRRDAIKAFAKQDFVAQAWRPSAVIDWYSRRKAKRFSTSRE